MLYQWKPGWWHLSWTFALHAEEKNEQKSKSKNKNLNRIFFCHHNSNKKNSQHKHTTSVLTHPDVATGVVPSFSFGTLFHYCISFFPPRQHTNSLFLFWSVRDPELRVSQWHRPRISGLSRHLKQPLTFEVHLPEKEKSQELRDESCSLSRGDIWKPKAPKPSSTSSFVARREIQLLHTQKNKKTKKKIQRKRKRRK